MFRVSFPLENSHEVRWKQEQSNNLYTLSNDVRKCVSIHISYLLVYFTLNDQIWLLFPFPYVLFAYRNALLRSNSEVILANWVWMSFNITFQTCNNLLYAKIWNMFTSNILYYSFWKILQWVPAEAYFIPFCVNFVEQSLEPRVNLSRLRSNFGLEGTLAMASGTPRSSTKEISRR